MAEAFGIGILLLWAVGAIFGYRRAVENGYSELAAFLGAILLGIFAPLLVLVRPRGKRCPHCRSIIDEKASVCPRCTRAVA